MVPFLLRAFVIGAVTIPVSMFQMHRSFSEALGMAVVLVGLIIMAAILPR